MASIALPSAATIRNIEWDYDQPAQVNRSDWTKRRQVVDQPGPAIWTGSFDLCVKIGATDDVLAIEAFLVDLEGQRNTFTLTAVEAAQAPDSLQPVVDGDGQGGRQLNLRGGTPGVTLKRGHKMTVGGQMVMLMAPATFNGLGKATVSYKAGLRLSPVDGTFVELRRPYVLVANTESSVGWKVDPGQQYTFKTLSVEEAF